MSCELSLGPGSLDSSRRRVSTLVIVFFACDFRGPGKTELALRTIPFFLMNDQSRGPGTNVIGP